MRVFDTYERNANTEVSIARVDPVSGEFLEGPDVLTENGAPVTVWSTHVSDVAFRFDGAMFISANEPGPRHPSAPRAPVARSAHERGGPRRARGVALLEQGCPLLIGLAREVLGHDRVVAGDRPDVRLDAVAVGEREHHQHRS